LTPELLRGFDEVWFFGQPIIHGCARAIEEGRHHQGDG